METHLFSTVSILRPNGITWNLSNRIAACGAWACVAVRNGFHLSITATIGAREYAEAGGLIGYGVDILGLYRRTAYFVDRILKGAKPADLPIEQPTKFQLIVNLKTAKALGLTIPQSLRVQAELIE